MMKTMSDYETKLNKFKKALPLYKLKISVFAR